MVCLHQPPHPPQPPESMDSNRLWGLLESLALEVLGETLSITQPAAVGLQATSFSVKRRPKDSKPQTEAHRHHLRETTAAGEEPTRAGRGLKGPRVEGGFLGQGHGTGGHQPAREAFAAPTESTSVSSGLRSVFQIRGNSCPVGQIRHEDQRCIQFS